MSSMYEPLSTIVSVAVKKITKGFEASVVYVIAGGLADLHNIPPDKMKEHLRRLHSGQEITWSKLKGYYWIDSKTGKEIT